jgi:hypothetical protein
LLSFWQVEEMYGVGSSSLDSILSDHPPTQTRLNSAADAEVRIVNTFILHTHKHGQSFRCYRLLDEAFRIFNKHCSEIQDHYAEANSKINQSRSTGNRTKASPLSLGDVNFLQQELNLLRAQERKHQQEPNSPGNEVALQSLKTQKLQIKQQLKAAS